MPRIDSRFTKTVVVPESRDRLWLLLEDVLERRRGLPGMESLAAEGEAVRWVLRPVGAAGVRFRPRWTSRFVLERPHAFVMEPATAPGDTLSLRARFDLDERCTGRETEVRADLELEVDLPIPWFAAPFARRLIDARIERMADRFLARLFAPAEAA